MGTDQQFFFQNLLILTVIEIKTIPNCFYNDKSQHLLGHFFSDVNLKRLLRFIGKLITS